MGFELSDQSSLDVLLWTSPSGKMGRGIEDGTSSATQFFVYQFDKRRAGLKRLAFEEGEFSVFGYAVKGEEEGFLTADDG